jgi:hypothetical protein
LREDFEELDRRVADLRDTVAPPEDQDGQAS